MRWIILLAAVISFTAGLLMSFSFNVELISTVNTLYVVSIVLFLVWVASLFKKY